MPLRRWVWTLLAVVVTSSWLLLLSPQAGAVRDHSRWLGTYVAHLAIVGQPPGETNLSVSPMDTGTFEEASASWSVHRGRDHAPAFRHDRIFFMKCGRRTSTGIANQVIQGQ